MVNKKRKSTSTSRTLKKVENQLLGELKHKFYQVHKHVDPSSSTPNYTNGMFSWINILSRIKEGTGHDERIGNEILIKTIELFMYTSSHTDDNKHILEHDFSGYIVRPHNPTENPNIDQFTGYDDHVNYYHGYVDIPTADIDTLTIPNDGHTSTSTVDHNPLPFYDPENGWIVSESLPCTASPSSELNLQNKWRHLKYSFKMPMKVKYVGGVPMENSLYAILLDHTKRNTTDKYTHKFAVKVHYYDP